MVDSDGRRLSAFIFDEEIEIKPSTELIPDEYERTYNRHFLAEVFYRDDDEVVKDLIQELETRDFLVRSTNAKAIDRDWIVKYIATVKESIETNSYDGLLMIFAKVKLNQVFFEDIWGSFTTATCPALKNKPKIFIYQDTTTQTAHDGPQIDLATAYDTPSEADILLIYDSVTGENYDFLEELYDNIQFYGNREDIINLATISRGSDNRPLVISTMTRKFFFAPSPYRGNHHDISVKHSETKQLLKQVKQSLNTKNEHHKKDKEKGFINSLKKTFSFRNESEKNKREDVKIHVKKHQNERRSIDEKNIEPEIKHLPEPASRVKRSSTLTKTKLPLPIPKKKLNTTGK